MSCVLDSSALLALLLAEPGSDRVLVAIADASMLTVNLAEVVGHFARLGVKEEEVRRTLDPLPFQRVPFDEDLAFLCGLMLPATRSAGLSLGDRACLALASRLGVPALTADRPWAAVGSSLGVRVDLLR